MSTFTQSLVQQGHGQPAPCSHCSPKLHDLQSLDDAINLLNTKAGELAHGSTAIWRIVDHARRHLERQVELAIDTSQFSDFDPN